MILAYCSTEKKHVSTKGFLGMPDLKWPPVVQGQTIIWYHFVTELKQNHDVSVHQRAFR